MEPTPQQVKENVLIGSSEPPPPNLEMPSRRNGLLEDLVVLGYVPITEVVIWDMGLVHQDRRHQLPKGLTSINPEDKSFGYLVGVWVRRSRLEHHPATRWPGNILPSWSHIVAAGQPNPSLAEAVCHELGFFTFFSLLFYCINTCCYSPKVLFKHKLTFLDYPFRLLTLFQTIEESQAHIFIYYRRPASRQERNDKAN